MRIRSVSWVAILIFYVPVFVFSVGFEDEIDRKETIVYSTKGHPKAKGINLNIKRPKSWIALDGDRPNIVQKFQSEKGKGRELVTVLIKYLPSTPSQETVRKLFSPDHLKKMIPPGGKVFTANSTMIDGEIAGISEYGLAIDVAGVVLKSRTIQINVIQKDILIQIDFSVNGGPDSSEKELAAQMDVFRPLFQWMGRSIVFPDKWK
jgi:hypothetical protein